ncbi:MAG TPA: type IA DNA topoisomerase [Nitrososphaeria archaeon]|nr:type IA DNA topoisomerase [Nitrososphaeria archaeon]
MPQSGERHRWIIVAEKPSVGRRIERLHIPSALVLSVRGHVLDVDFPEGYDWRDVPPSKLFDVKNLRFVIRDEKIYRSLKRTFLENREATLVIATDNDPEGELIGWEIAYIYQQVVKENAKPFYRMRFNSTDYAELKRAWDNKELGLNMRWVEKAAFRRDFDLITGAAFTRLLTLSTRKAGARVRVLSWGSCQAPTLYFVVQREKAILNFKPEKFWRIIALLENEKGEKFWAFSEKFSVKEKAEKAYRSIKREKVAIVERYEENSKRISRPLPIRTDELLRDASRFFGIPASKTLAIAEDLYGQGYISYPRTDTNIYRKSFDFVKYAEAAARGLGLDPMHFRSPNPRQGKRDDGAHTPIYPLRPYRGEGNARRIWEHVARRFLANAFYEDAEKVKQVVTISIKGIFLHASGSRISRQGFFKILPYMKPSEKPLPRMISGQKLKVVKIDLREEETKPPPRLTEPELLKILEKWNIGTDATRATYPDLITSRGYTLRKRKTFHPTPLGFRLIEILTKIDETLVSPETRKRVEEMMTKIERGEIDMETAKNNMLSLYKELFRRLEEKIDEVAQSLANTIGYEKKTLMKKVKR